MTKKPKAKRAVGRPYKRRGIRKINGWGQELDNSRWHLPPDGSHSPNPYAKDNWLLIPLGGEPAHCPAVHREYMCHYCGRVAVICTINRRTTIGRVLWEVFAACWRERREGEKEIVDAKKRNEEPRRSSEK